MNWRSPVWLGIGSVVSVLLATLIYAPSFPGSFVFDDRYQFYAQAQDPGPWSQYLLGPRPLVQLSYLLNHAVAGNAADAYRTVNAAIHGLNAVAAGMLVFEMALLGAAAAPIAAALALVASAIFLTHPLQSEAVAYISARTDLLCAFFFLLALTMFVRSRERRRMSWWRAGGITLAFVMAIASKEHAAVLPALLLILEWLYRERWGGWRSGQAPRLYVVLGVFAAAGGTFIGLYLSFARTIGSGAGVSPLTYFFTQWRSVARYLQLTALPLTLNLDYEWPLSRTPLEHGALAMLAAVVAAVGAVIWRRDRGGMVWAGLALAALTLAPTSSFVPLADLIAERRMYLPVAGLLVAGTGVAAGAGVSRRALQGGGAVLALALAAGAYSRAGIWGDPVRLWQDTAAKSPGKFRPQYWLARAYFEAGQCGPAAAAFRTAQARMGPGDDPFDLELAVAMDCAGDTRGAADVLGRLLAANPAQAQAMALRGRLHLREGRTDLGIADLDRALALDPAQATALATRGEARLALNQLAGGIADLEQAFAISGPDPRLVLLLDRAKVKLAMEQEKQAAGARPAR